MIQQINVGIQFQASTKKVKYILERCKRNSLNTCISTEGH